MASFRVETVYYVPRQDLLVLAGTYESGTVQAGWAIDLPREINGPGWVPIYDVQRLSFADGSHKQCLVLDYEVITGAQLMKFSDLEGVVLEVRAAPG